jgi:hypothetical protein
MTIKNHLKRSGMLILLCVFICATAIAQADANYTGPGKMYVKSFWNHAELLKNGKGSALTVGNMKRALDNAKEKDPALNTAAMDSELKKWQDDADKKLDAEKSPEQKAADAKSGGYTGAAKNQVKYFWDRALQPTEKISEGELNGNIRDMEYALKATKEKDPAYNASEMESALKKIKDDVKEKKLAEVRGTSGDRRKAPQENAAISNDPVKLMEKLFIDANISVGSSSDLPEAPAKIEAYKAKFTKLISMDYTDAPIKTGRNAKGNISGFKASTEREMNKIAGILKEARENSSMEYSYYTIQFHQAFWDAAQKVFSEESSYADMYKKTTTAFTGMGSLEQLYAKAAANRIEHIKNTKLPPATVKDASLEKILMEGFNKKYGQEYKGTALKAVLTQDGWTIERNNISGIVTGRNRTGKIAYKGTDGKCYLLSNNVFIYQAFIGNSFSNTEVIYHGLGGEEMLCGNVK